MTGSVIEWMERWQDGETPGPRTLVLFPTMRCNLRCGICMNDSIQCWGDLKEELPDERLLALVDESAELGVEEWVIGGGGEPMMRGNLVVELCSRIRARGMNGRLQTNGTLFSEEQLQKLVREGWADLTISLDGPTSEINDAIRSKGAFAKAVAALGRVQEIKRELGMTLPTVNIITVLTALNYGALPDMVSLCGDLGCTQLSVREVMLLTDAAHRFLLTDDCRAALPEVVARARDLAAKQGLVSNLDSYYESLTASAESGSAPTAASATGKLIEAPCFSPWHTLMVYPSGRISPCCVLWEEGADSVRTMSLREVWMGAYLQGVRDRIQNSGLLPACANCPPEFILDNAAIREKLAWTARERAHSSLTPLGIARKVLTNLRRHGVGESLRRGKTWMKLQLELRTRRRGSR